MLSILVPVYNCDVFPLVQGLHAQAQQANIPFEIIVLDDASPNKGAIQDNFAINSLNNCLYEVLPKNIGRSAIRNLLAGKAKYEWLLFLDSDTAPVNNNFIRNYLPYLNDEEKVVYGGIIYQEEKPEKDMLLRWVYGNEREAMPKEVRVQSPYRSLLTLNFAIKRSIFEKVRFNETIPNLRHEDTLFSYNLSQQQIKVEHIANPVYHLGLESSMIFLRKTEEAAIGFKYLLDHKLLDKDYLKIGTAYTKLRVTGLTSLSSASFKLCRGMLRKNLLGPKPSMLVYDLYRLGYLCYLK